MMDLKAKIEEIIETVKNDKDFANKFKKDPVAAVKTVVGVDVPTDQLNQIIDGVKAKISFEEAGELLGKAKGLFKK